MGTPLLRTFSFSIIFSYETRAIRTTFRRDVIFLNCIVFLHIYNKRFNHIPSVIIDSPSFHRFVHNTITIAYPFVTHTHTDTHMFMFHSGKGYHFLQLYPNDKSIFFCGVKKIRCSINRYIRHFQVTGVLISAPPATVIPVFIATATLHFVFH